MAGSVGTLAQTAVKDARVFSWEVYQTQLVHESHKGEHDVVGLRVL